MSGRGQPLKSLSVPGRDRRVGAVLVLVAILFQALWLGWPAVLLSVALVLSYGLWVATTWRVRPRLRTVFAIGVAIFLAHVAEEFLTGFHRDLPELAGSRAWSGPQFLVFNGAWAIVFVASAVALAPGRHLPVLALLFFAVAGGLGNGVAHLAFVLQRGAYFPGAWTALVMFALGVWMLRMMYAGDGVGAFHGAPAREADESGPA